LYSCLITTTIPVRAPNSYRQNFSDPRLPPSACAGRCRRGVLTNRGAAACRGPSFGPANGPHLAAVSASAEKQLVAIGLEPRYGYSGRHLDSFQNLSRSRIDSPQIALVAFPGAVPQFSVDPGNSGDEAIGLDRAKNRSCIGVDLIDLPITVLPYPERPFGPREPRATAVGRRDCGEHSAGLRVDLLDAIPGELVEVPAVERRSCIRGDVDRAQ